MTTTSWLSAGEAARTLGVKRTTLYAYVSRGLIRSESGTGATRERRYARDDVDRLDDAPRSGAIPTRSPRTRCSGECRCSSPSITLIADETLYYRGHDAVALARAASVEAVASLIWTGRLDGAAPATRAGRSADPGSQKRDPFIVRAQAGARARVGGTTRRRSTFARTASCEPDGAFWISSLARRRRPARARTSASTPRSPAAGACATAARS